MISPPPLSSYICFQPTPHLPPSGPNALRRTVVNKQNQTASRQSGFWGSPPQNFFGPVTARSSKPSQGGALCRRQEPVAWSARAEGGGRWRGGRVRGRRGKGTFAVQLAALCEAGTVGPYREESESEAFSSLLPPPPLVSFPPHSVPSLSLAHTFVLTALVPLFAAGPGTERPRIPHLTFLTHLHHLIDDVA